MGWFKTFARSKFDDEILELYGDIELLIFEIDEQLTSYLEYVFQTAKDYAKNNPNKPNIIKKNKKYYSIHKVNFFMKKIKEDFAYCHTIRHNKKKYNFNKSDNARKEKEEILFELTKVKVILEKIYEEIESLDRIHINNNDLSSLVNYLEEAIKVDNILKSIQESDKHKVFKIIEKIIDEAEKNKRKNLWLISQQDKKSKLFFSQNLKISEIKMLELIPLIELEGLEKRSLFVNELHKDNSLPIFHYNLEIGARNIHVIPRGLKNKIKPFIKSA